MKILKVIYNFLRGIFRFLFFVIVCLICTAIAMIGNETGTKEITVRKAKRIRKLTGLKIWAYKKLPHLMKFLGEYNYLKNLYIRLNYGV